MSNNWVTRLRGRALTYSNAVLSGICNYNVSAARKLAIDTNGLGIGLLDFMVKAQETDDGEYLPPFGI